ncbi:MAG: winged helix-turn-helix transcriptional regulator [Candidatus Nitrosocosmicus sp.]
MSKNSNLPANHNNNNTKESNNKRHLFPDFAIDETNLKIIRELVENPNVKSSEISEKLQIPLSTIQRRKAKIENLILRKNYYFNFSDMGYRTADIFLNINNGKVVETGKQIIKLFENNVLRATSRINSKDNLCIEIIFENSRELHDILERMKSIDHIANVSFSEIVNVLGDNTNSIVLKLLT